jgi:hypothetical protein
MVRRDAIGTSRTGGASPMHVVAARDSSLVRCHDGIALLTRSE